MKIFKFLAFIILLALTLSGCNSNMSNKSEIDNSETINFTEIELIYTDWEKIEFPIDPKEVKIPADVKAISTKEVAINVGKAIIENCQANNKFLDYELLSVVHSVQDNIWYLEYSIDQRENTDGTYLLCGGLYVAIDGNKGELINAWFEEG